MLTLFFLFFLYSLTELSSYGKAEKIIIDTDAGSDDAVAIFLLLRAEASKKSSSLSSKFEIVAITCSYGNTKEENVEINVLKILTIANRSDIPVYGGSKKPLIGQFSSDGIFGEDGFGDAEFNGKIIGKVDRSRHASLAMIELSMKHEGNISVVIIGPTTNTALAAALDNDFPSRVKSFYVMGSSVSGYGMLRPNVEFNFGADPEANHILLNSSTSASHLIIFPWEAALEANYSMTWRKEIFGRLVSPYVDFVNAVEDLVLSKQETMYVPADAMMVAAAMLRPETVTRRLMDLSVEAVIDGAARGSVLVDYRPKQFWTKPENARIIRTIDVGEFERLMIDLLSCETIKC